MDDRKISFIVPIYNAEAGRKKTEEFNIIIKRIRGLVRPEILGWISQRGTIFPS